MMVQMQEVILAVLQQTLNEFPEFPGFIAGDIESGDPHAMTVSYDVEALWVFDDIDSVWREQADHAHQTFPKHGNQPGVNDDFHDNDSGSIISSPFMITILITLW